MKKITEASPENLHHLRLTSHISDGEIPLDRGISGNNLVETNVYVC
jgi:hypothetical protein